MKQVPDTTARRELLSDFRLKREGVDNVINPFDEYAIEEALRLRDVHGGEVAIVTMGPPGAEESIRKALAMGADRGVLITDPALVGTDWSGTCTVLAKALTRSSFDLVMLGTESTDARSGLVPGGLSEILDLPLVTYAMRVEISGSTVHLDRQIAGGYAEVSTELPCIVSVVKGANDPRYPSLKGIMAAKRKEIAKLSLSDLGVDPQEVGFAGARTIVSGAKERSAREPGQVLTPESAEQAAAAIADFLQSRKFI